MNIQKTITYTDFSILVTQTPDSSQSSTLDSLILSCHQNGENVPEFSFSDDEENVFLFLMRSDGSIPAVLSLSILDNETAECRAVTAPAFRRQGYFSALLNEAETLAGERDILFPLPDSCADGLAVMHALEAECLSTEYEMACQLDASIHSSSPIHCNNPCYINQNSTLFETAKWTLVAYKGENEDSFSLHVCEKNEEVIVDDQTNFDATSNSSTVDFIGSCLTTRTSENGVCLHHVEIREDLRGKGFGTILIRKLLKQLAEFGVKRVILQVSGDNTPALSLYKKTGFAITQSLSYYLY
ncbi:GNAT family N-acetyltransferase [Brotaphodocola sp.]|uniref:GNAT family N-acetyltransferase n=1 Tax=Brotaphodocola sp. TaxID=3073577 RepID=UPI003D7DCCEC